MPILTVDVSCNYKPVYHCWSYTSGRRYGHGTVILIYSRTKKHGYCTEINSLNVILRKGC